MRTRRFARPLALVLSLVAVAAPFGCGDGGGGNGGSTNFDAFVLDQVQNQTTDTAEPVEVAGRAFRFDEDPAAFDELFR